VYPAPRYTEYTSWFYSLFVVHYDVKPVLVRCVSSLYLYVTM
jgi:hypothetical protein